jgi:hypothetical protein
MNHTRTGIVFVLIGLFIFIIPIINLVMPFLFLFAFIEFVRGRDEFDNHHRLNVIFAFAFFIVFLFVFFLGSLLIALFSNQYMYEIMFILTYSILMIVFLLAVKIFVKRIILTSFAIPIFASVILGSFINSALVLALIFLITIYLLAYKEINRYQVYVDDNRQIQHAKVVIPIGSAVPKEFDYYCPACLFQTNDELKICPKCNEKKMIKIE